jgi:hypothetical protein
MDVEDGHAYSLTVLLSTNQGSMAMNIRSRVTPKGLRLFIGAPLRGGTFPQARSLIKTWASLRSAHPTNCMSKDVDGRDKPDHDIPSSPPALVTTGHGRSKNGVASLAYAGGPC